MKAIAALALIGLATLVAGLVTRDDLMADAGLSAFILGSMVVSALLLRKRRTEQRAKATPDSERVPLTVALTEAALHSMRQKTRRK